MNKLPQKILCFVTPYLPKQEKSIPFIEFTKYAIDGGVNMIQIRDKNTSINILEKFSEKIYQFAGNEVCIMINAKFPSLSTHISGTHFPEKVNVTRFSPLPKNKLFGQSVHSINSAINSEKNKLDYITVGSIYKSHSHPNGISSGTKLIKNISNRTNIPIIAIGGITEQNAESVIKSGADGIALISEITKNKNPYNITKSLSKIIGIR